MPRVMLAVFSNPTSADTEDEFNEWYDVHVKDLVAVPGVNTAQRFRLVDLGGSLQKSKQRYLALYEIETDDVAALDAELDRLYGTEAMPSSPTITDTLAFYWEPIGPRVT